MIGVTTTTATVGARNPKMPLGPIKAPIPKLMRGSFYPSFLGAICTSGLSNDQHYQRSLLRRDISLQDESTFAELGIPNIDRGLVGNCAAKRVVVRGYFVQFCITCRLTVSVVKDIVPPMATIREDLHKIQRHSLQSPPGLSSDPSATAPPQSSTPN